jgi:hypothetical protein
VPPLLLKRRFSDTLRLRDPTKKARPARPSRAPREADEGVYRPVVAVREAAAHVPRVKPTIGAGADTEWFRLEEQYLNEGIRLGLGRVQDFLLMHR